MRCRGAGSCFGCFADSDWRKENAAKAVLYDDVSRFDCMDAVMMRTDLA